MALGLGDHSEEGICLGAVSRGMRDGGLGQGTPATPPSGRKEAIWAERGQAALTLSKPSSSSLRPALCLAESLGTLMR